MLTAFGIPWAFWNTVKFKGLVYTDGLGSSDSPCTQVLIAHKSHAHKSQTMTSHQHLSTHMTSHHNDHIAHKSLAHLPCT